MIIKAFLLLSIFILPVHAFEFKLEKNVITITGKLNAPSEDMKNVKEFIDFTKYHSIKTINLENMPGGSVAVADELAKFISLYKYNTVISGGCYSACTRIFVAGNERQFSKRHPLNKTSLGLHGITVNSNLINYHDALHTRYMQMVRNLDPKIIRIIPELKGDEMVYAYHPSLSKKAVGICKMQTLDIKCEFMEGDALSNGLLTSEKLFKIE